MSDLGATLAAPLARFLRATRADIRRTLWRYQKPRKDRVLADLSCRRAKLRLAHKSAGAVDRAARTCTTDRLKCELGVMP